MDLHSIHCRNEFNTLAQHFLPIDALQASIQGMPHRKPPFRDLIEAAAKPHRELWKSSGELNLGALARYYEQRGHGVSQASFSRIFAGLQQPGEDTIDATHHVFRIPREILRGEPLSSEMEDLFTKYKLSTLLLAQKIESLPKDDYYLLCQQMERALENAEKLRQSLKNNNITDIRRPRSE